MTKIYERPQMLIIEIDYECICGNPHSASDWKPGDGKPPWAGGGHGHHAQEYRNTLWEDDE